MLPAEFLLDDQPGDLVQGHIFNPLTIMDALEFISYLQELAEERDTIAAQVATDALDHYTEVNEEDYTSEDAEEHEELQLDYDIAIDDAVAEVTQYLEDVTQHGCASGIVTGLIYYSDTHAFASKHRDEIQDMLSEYYSMAGAWPFTPEYDIRNSCAWWAYDILNSCAWWAYETVASQILSEYS